MVLNVPGWRGRIEAEGGESPVEERIARGRRGPSRPMPSFRKFLEEGIKTDRGPFTFEGTRRAELSEQGLSALSKKVDTIIAVDNNRLLSSLEGEPSLDEAFRMADEVLRLGVQSIAELVTVPGDISSAAFWLVAGFTLVSFLLWLALPEGHRAVPVLECTWPALLTSFVALVFGKLT